MIWMIMALDGLGWPWDIKDIERRWKMIDVVNHPRNQPLGGGNFHHPKYIWDIPVYLVYDWYCYILYD